MREGLGTNEARPQRSAAAAVKRQESKDKVSLETPFRERARSRVRGESRGEVKDERAPPPGEIVGLRPWMRTMTVGLLDRVYRIFH